jgi:hypothetical protein
MRQSPASDRAPDEQSVATRRHWHAPEFHFLDLGSTELTHGTGPDNPGHEGTHS